MAKPNDGCKHGQEELAGGRYGCQNQRTEAVESEIDEELSQRTRAAKQQDVAHQLWMCCTKTKRIACLSCENYR